MSDEEIKKILNQIIKRNGVTFFGYTSKEVGNIAIKEALNLIDKLQKELKEKTTILMVGADKVKQLQKENKELKEKIKEHEKGETPNGLR